MSLPREAQRQVIDFVAFLQAQYERPLSREQAVRVGDLASEPFIGMWSERQDMEDSSAWVRRAREQEWATVHE